MQLQQNPLYYCHNTKIVFVCLGTFGQVLECWDRESKEMVAIKIVRAVKKYSDAALIEIDVLQQLARNDAAGKQ